MVTTIQLNENIKQELDKRKFGKETYEDVIVNLMKLAEEHKRKQKELLIESCRVMAEENLRITKEFESIENLDEWKW